MRAYGHIALTNAILLFFIMALLKSIVTLFFKLG